MRTIDFSNLGSIQDLQICSENTGYLLTNTDELYSFKGDSCSKVQIPKEIEISDFYFKNINSGVIIGNKTDIKIINKSSIVGTGNGLFLLILLATLFISKVCRCKQFIKVKYLYLALGILLIFYSCSTNWIAYKTVNEKQPFITSILSTPKIQYTISTHNYFSNKNQESYIAFTENGGKDWLVQKLPTNFYANSVTQIGENYFVGTFANFNTSDKIPYHGDGDIYIYGNDTTYSNILSKNSDYKSPLVLDIQRGVNGFYQDSINGLIYIYGAETEPQTPKDEVSTSEGNISQISVDLQSNYKIIDTPGISNVMSFSKGKDGTLWATLDNKIPIVFKGHIKFEDLPNKALYKLSLGSMAWELVTINDSINSFKQVVFIQNSQLGYVIGDKNGELFKTLDGGEHWKSTNILGVKKIVSIPDCSAVLNEKNELIYL